MKRAQRGFTLVELVVACTILALLAVLGWRGLDSVMRARTALTQDMEQLRRTQLAFAQLENDCANLADLAGWGERAVLSSDGGQIVLVRMLPADGQPTQLQVVRYRLKDGNLLRAASAGTRELGELDAQWQRASVGDTVLQEVVLQGAVNGMAVRAWNGERAAWRSGANVAYDAPPGRPRVRPLETGLELTLAGSHGPLRKVFMLGRG